MQYDKDVKQMTEKDLVYALEWYKVFANELSETRKKLFELKLGLGGFIIVIFSIVFSDLENLKNLSPVLSYGLIVIVVCVA